MYRRRRGLSQQQLSRVSGVAQPIISEIESGKAHYPTFDTVLKLAKALEVSVYELDEDGE